MNRVLQMLQEGEKCLAVYGEAEFNYSLLFKQNQ